MSFENIIYIILAILGLGLLIFIHELGHYLMAKQSKMRIDVFSIGFGKPIFKWKFQKTSWQIGWIPFGGYVKIAGMQPEKGQNPYEVKDGFFGKKPYKRMLVAFMGPAFNFFFALVAFTIVWMLGGKDSALSQYTKRIGWIDTNSDLFTKGLRIGDEITVFNQKPYKNFQDLMTSSGLKNASAEFDGYFVNSFEEKKTPFHLATTTYEWKDAVLSGMYTSGIQYPAQQLIFIPEENHISFLKEAGMEKNDRLIWADGEFIYSYKQLDHLINESSVIITVKRNGQVVHLKVPRLLVTDLKLSSSEQEDIDDWRHDAKLLKTDFQELYFIPFFFNETLHFEKPIAMIDQKNNIIPMTHDSFSNEKPRKGDRILRIDGEKVHSAGEALNLLQKRRVLMIVERNSHEKIFTPEHPDIGFENPAQSKRVLSLITKGFNEQKASEEDENFFLIKPLEPKRIKNFTLSVKQKQALEKISKEDSAYFEHHLFLDIPLGFHDAKVQDNLNPLLQAKNMLAQMGHMVASLFQGKVKFQWLSGPVGIVHLMQESWKSGGKEVLTWMAFISLNLGVINLLPLPALDGGHIVFSLIEMIRRKPLSIRLMETLSLIFFAILFAGIIYLTYQDIVRMIQQMF